MTQKWIINITVRIRVADFGLPHARSPEVISFFELGCERVHKCKAFLDSHTIESENAIFEKSIALLDSLWNKAVNWPKYLQPWLEFSPV